VRLASPRHGVGAGDTSVSIPDGPWPLVGFHQSQLEAVASAFRLAWLDLLKEHRASAIDVTQMEERDISERMARHLHVLAQLDDGRAPAFAKHFTTPTYDGAVIGRKRSQKRPDFTVRPKVCRVQGPAGYFETLTVEAKVLNLKRNVGD
jgi:hypothetical protein